MMNSVRARMKTNKQMPMRRSISMTQYSNLVVPVWEGRFQFDLRWMCLGRCGARLCAESARRGVRAVIPGCKVGGFLSGFGGVECICCSSMFSVT